MDKNKNKNTSSEWSLTFENCDVDDELFHKYCCSPQMNISETKAEPVNKGKSEVNTPLTIKINLDLDTKTAESNLENLGDMLDEINKRLDEMKSKMSEYKPADEFTTLYNNCTFLYGEHGRAEVYNESDDIDRKDETNIEKNKYSCDCDED